MSTLSQRTHEFDFWEYVNCAKCQLPLMSDTGATVPFWLTECGHVLCNAHLNADQSCTQCKAPGIQLVPLQREMDAPMSDWFRSIPYGLDAIAYAAKFQQESMASQIRYFKSRHHQQRIYIDKLKHEVADLKNANSTLQNDILRMENGNGYQQQPYRANDMQEPSDVANSHGKRQMMESQHRPSTMSSPSRSVVTPLGPNRLTLPPGQQPPNLSSNYAPADADGPSPEAPANNHGHPQQVQNRPGSSRFIQKYAYVPPSTPQVHPPQMSHAQAAPRMIQRTRQHPEPQAQIPQGRSQESMPPPRFKPAGPPPNNHKTNTRSGQYEQQAAHQDARTDTRPRKVGMGPPPTPQHVRHLQPGSLGQPQMMQSNAALSSRRPTNSVPVTNRFLPPEERFAPQSLKPTQRFVPPTPTSAPQRFTGGAGPGAPSGSTSNSRAPSRAPPSNMAGGGQRMPFVPGGHRGFGS